MASKKNGKFAKKDLTKLPNSWSSRGRDEYLLNGPYASASRMLARAVAETGVNFQINDAYRPFEEQEGFFYDRYYKVDSGGDRVWNGQHWKLRAGQAKAAIPGTSNHGEGLSLDLAPTAIQQWMRRNGAKNGWVNDVPSEPWHWSYLNPGSDRYRSEGALDHAAVQKAVGAEVDGKIGTGTVAKIKAFQKKHGLEVDGKVGTATKGAMGLSGKGEAAPAPSVKEPVSGEVAESGGYQYTYTREQWDTQGISESVHPFETTVEGVYLHYPASGNVTMAGESVAQISKRLRGYRHTHIATNGWFDIGYNAAVDMSGNSYELRGLGNESGANGGTVSNNHGVAILHMLGNNEKPSAAMIEASNGLIAQVAEKRESLAWIKGHLQSPDASTECPGEPIMVALAAGSFVLDGKPGASAGPDVKLPANEVDEDGRLGTETVAELQERLGVKVDGRAAEDTWLALQAEVNAPYKDGQISRQSHKAEDLGNGIVDRASAWEYTGPNSKGSQTVKKLQRELGVKVDGVWGEETTLALQKRMNNDPAALRR